MELTADTAIWLIGGDCERADWAAIEAAIARVPADRFRLFLYHYPPRVLDVAGKVDLMLSGHTHGGQVALPFYGALTTLSATGKQFEKGFYEVGGTRLYVNRGIGMEGKPVPPIRFLARPEVTLVELAPQGQE